MKKYKKSMLIIASSVGVYLLFTMSVAYMAKIDYSRVKEGLKPVFAGRHSIYADGGSIEYNNWFYHIIDTHAYSMSPRPGWAHGDSWAYDVGPALVYQWPILCPYWQNKSEIKLMINEEHKSLFYMSTPAKDVQRSLGASGGAGR